ncbi:adenosylmethionine decarboxylase [Epibacterium sp. SM1969]|uniref:S-adenosylmethionine decarboxylase proenzyme n=1 Tax=Tritonibacter aquimaris TaxID=2663379 RepID=A0A844AQR6_9RHOB|nr:adenosylmethionine decarboxylase [Tritonibacter aquimaris]MQY41358.1 adenosylmethionine decarboxylase [Tritonibacter aquimaris]
MTLNTAAPHHHTNGLHLLIDLYNGSHLDDTARIEAAFHAIVEACGATLIRCHTHRFAPHGVTGVALLAESHISAHTWPEQGFAAFDVFMCGNTNPHAAIDVIKTYFESDDITVREVPRGR